MKGKAFTLAEVLITLGIIGVVAAITVPSLITNIHKRVWNEQSRNVKYKLTLATDKMKSLGLIGSYSSTEDFVKELQKHLKIAKICKGNELSKCWPTNHINTADGPISVDTLTTGNKIKSLVLGTTETDTIGIVTGDGISMLLTYSSICTPLEPEKTYNWTTDENNKPITNATTNCISALYDINGDKSPNYIGKDVRTLNSLFGYKFRSVSPTISDCSESTRQKYGLNDCVVGGAYDGAKKYCQDLGMKFPNEQLASILLGSRIGKTEFNTKLSLATKSFYHCTINNPGYYCVDSFESGTLPEINTRVFWLDKEPTSTLAWTYYGGTSVARQGRNNTFVSTLCVVD